ncbi:Dabb family protein [Streptomyces sp. NPDC091268]|uniref:Dabb family protein n=1 Tax=Streptomyces sp. NPDC091268 TaxID=3365979 RepID=UPI0038202637
MIRHIALFKFKPGYDWEHPKVAAAEALAVRIGEEVPELLEWRAGRNVTDREVAYDYAIVGLVPDEGALGRYLVHPFHQRSADLWKEISTWVIADLEEPAPRA